MSALAQFIAEAKARIPMSSVVGSRVVLKKAGRELTGLCVWHSDRKPSMTVNDEKGFAHCFACGGHADLVHWLLHVERLDWRETIERLAELSGLPVPERSAAAAERAKRIDGLRPTLEAVQGLMLRQMPERVMRWMVEKRGFAPALIDAFGLGYAPASEDWLRGSLGRMGLGLDALTECGVMGQSDKGFRYVRMKHRLTIPIYDGSGRLIGHGGRALPVELLAAGEQVRGDAPKYLNSPETPLFDKSRVLFNLHRARAMVSLHSPPVVVEGYLDVMRLDGLELPAMAPMGTALTEAQLVALWRLHPCPVLMFDGDAAGQKAALRACDTALPGIGPGRSLKVALLPEAVDPDDLGKAEGRAGLDAVISSAMPMHDFVFGAVANSGDLGSPEAVAAIWQALDERLAMISDGEVRAQYRVLWRRRFEAEVSLGRDDRPPVVRVGHDAAGQLVVLGAVAKTSGTEADEGGYVWPDDDRESAQRLAMLVARDMELGRQIKELQADRRDVRALAKAIGFDAKAFAAVIRDIEADTEKREEREASHALYRQVLGVKGPMTEAMLPRLDDARLADARRVSARRTARGMLIEARAAQLGGR